MRQAVHFQYGGAGIRVDRMAAERQRIFTWEEMMKANQKVEANLKL